MFTVDLFLQLVFATCLFFQRSLMRQSVQKQSYSNADIMGTIAGVQNMEVSIFQKLP